MKRIRRVLGKILDGVFFVLESITSPKQCYRQIKYRHMESKVFRKHTELCEFVKSTGVKVISITEGTDASFGSSNGSSHYTLFYKANEE